MSADQATTERPARRKGGRGSSKRSSAERHPPAFVAENERRHVEQTDRLKDAAREMSTIADTILQVSARTTAALTHPAMAACAAAAPVRATAAHRQLVTTLTRENGLGFAFSGGRVGAAVGGLGRMADRDSLAILVMATSLRLRLAALQIVHPELTQDPKLVRIIDAVNADRDVEMWRALRELFRHRGAVDGLSRLAPMAVEIFSLKALLDENPLNDHTAWKMASGRGAPTADPLIGVSTWFISRLDRGEGGARPIEMSAYEASSVGARGSLLDFVRNIRMLGNDGRIIIQTITGPDGAHRHVVQAPGMRPGGSRNDSPQDLVGAFRATLENWSTYSGALHSAIADYGIPEGDEVALVGHSAGGSAIMNLAQEETFCGRYRLTNAVAIGSPVDHKVPADPRTRVATITNQHDIVPTLDGTGAGSCYDHHPDWYVVDYTEPFHQFPECHSPSHYLNDLEHRLGEAREHIDEQLEAYHGEVVRTQMYQIYDEPPAPDGFPFLTTPRFDVATESGSGTVELPLTCSDGDGLLAYFTVSPGKAAALMENGSPARPLLIGNRALVAVFAADHRESNLGPYKEVVAGIVVHAPWKDGMFVLTDLVRDVDRRGLGIRVVGSVVDTEAARDAQRQFWRIPAELGDIGLSVGRQRVRVTLGEKDGEGADPLVLGGFLGPGLLSPAYDTVLYTRSGRDVYRATFQVRGRIWGHPGALCKLNAGTSELPLAETLRRLGLDGARPLACLSARSHHSKVSGAAVFSL
ncbi:hypothetical protein J4573_40455 [Actinomadura barringtoniae]|uniref:Fungal lipase-like domain-containing protein n=1 Tax=Actinomadura barringtoniae TaxID=1427535 RepID=A0A939PRH2_9ACTN|nr:hypothetical protein [Actinomadura barringtoniae]MBO2453421.1 hypothetical protein [Actinomadura barringtoniae]